MTGTIHGSSVSFLFFCLITYTNRGGNFPSDRKKGISAIPPGDPWMTVLARNGVSTSFMDHASGHLAFGIPPFLIQASKQRATGASQHAEIRGVWESLQALRIKAQSSQFPKNRSICAALIVFPLKSAHSRAITSWRE